MITSVKIKKKSNGHQKLKINATKSEIMSLDSLYKCLDSKESPDKIEEIQK